MLAGSASAARLVPKLAPLQPIPEDSTPSINQNVNSTNSPYSQSQKLEQSQTVPKNSTPGPAPDQSPSPNQVVETSAASEPVGLYWTLLILGLLGCGGVIGWAYLRFRK